jgi:hypothetical protein
MGTVNISFDLDDIADCEKAAAEISILIELRHGPAAARRLFLSHTKSPRQLQKDANLRLMVAYMGGQISAKQCARELAEKNKSLPRDHRYGGGSVSPEALEKQIRREKKRMERDGFYRDMVEWFVTQSRDIS